MPLLELKRYGVATAGLRLSGIDMSIDEGAMLVVLGRRESGAGLLALGIAGLLPEAARTEGTLAFSGRRVGYLDTSADVEALATRLAAGADLIVAN